jgi:eukaryotic-like serine/threonine-protein kinase
MPIPDVFALSARLVESRLLEQNQVDQAMLSLGSGSGSAEELLNVLESRSLLTSYQVSKIKKNDWSELVLGNCKLMYQNASGSFARVFRAASVSDSSVMIGVKVLRQRWAKEPKHVQSFHREAQLGMTLQHANIVPILNHGVEANTHYLTMEFVEGGNLRDFIQIRKQLDPREAMQYTLDMASGLGYALQMGFTHRDLKLTNVLMSSRGVAKLVDFGLAGTDDEAHHQRAVEYATIEKATGAPRNDPRSDIFFLGTIVYELILGQPPYEPTSRIEERKLVSRYRQIRPLEQAAPHLPRAVTNLVGKMISFQPESRYQDYPELIRDLNRVLEELNARKTDSSITRGTNHSGNHQSTAENSQDASVEKSPGDESLPRVLCVESRIKQQDVLRDYLSSRGFRPLVIGDLDRALKRMQTDPAECLVLFGETLKDELFDAFQEASHTAEKHPFAIVSVLAADQVRKRSHLKKTASRRILLPPSTLRDLRKEIHLALRHIHSDSGELKTAAH